MRGLLFVVMLCAAVIWARPLAAETAAVGLFAEANDSYRQGSYDTAREKVPRRRRHRGRRCSAVLQSRQRLLQERAAGRSDCLV